MYRAHHPQAAPLKAKFKRLFLEPFFCFKLYLNDGFHFQGRFFLSLFIPSTMHQDCVREREIRGVYAPCEG